MVLSACGGGAAESGGEKVTVDYAGGSIDVSSRITGKIEKKEDLNFTLSYPYITIAGASQQLQVGAERAAAELEKKYGSKINITVVGVPEPDAPTQIGQITSRLSAEQIDCLGVLPTPPGAFSKVINQTIEAGIPVFTVNGDTDESARIATSTANDNSDLNDPSALGMVAANAAIDWAEANNQTFDGKKVALVTGDASAPWAQGRLQAFSDTLKAKYPTVTFVGTPKDAYMMGFDSDALAKLQAFATGHEDVFFYFSSDQGGVQIGQMIKTNNLKGKVFGMGVNLSSAYLPLLEEEYLIGTVDQRYDLQGQHWVEMCGDVLFEKTAPEEFQFVEPTVWNAANLDEALKLYNSIPNNGVTSN